MKMLFRSPMLALFALALFCACRGAGSASQAPRAAGAGSTDTWSSDPELERDLAVRNPALIAEPQGKRIEFTLENSTNHALDFLFAISGYDRAGHRLPPAQPQWTALRLGPGASQGLQVELGSPLIESWRLHVLRPGTAHP